MGEKGGHMAIISHTDLGPGKGKQNKNNSASPNSLLKILLCFSEYSVRDCGKKQRWFPKTMLLQGMWQVKAWKEKQQERAFNLKRYPYFKEKKMKVIWHLYLGSWQSSQSKKKKREMSELLRLQVNPNQLSYFQILQIFSIFPTKLPEFSNLSVTGSRTSDEGKWPDGTSEQGSCSEHISRPKAPEPNYSSQNPDRPLLTSAQISIYILYS